MKHSPKKYTNRMFNGLIEMAITNAYNIYRYHHTIEESSAHGFRHEFMCDLSRRMLEIADELANSGRRRTAGNEAENRS
jgi:YD repeat-containing protein